MDKTTDILRIENISYRYDDRYLALNNVSATFGKGEMVAVLGSNGAGKSTFFLCCNGVLRPGTGRIVLNGKEITRAKKDVYVLRRAVGLVFQDPDSQFIAGSVESEVSFGPMNLHLPQDEVESRVEQSLAQLNISRYRNHAPQYLSGGEKKRVSIADILAMRPEIILLDEPTASLDPGNSEALEGILRELNNEGITVIISTHDVNFAYRIAQRAIVFAQGEIIADKEVDKVFEETEILKRAGLEKPLLYAAYEMLQNGAGRTLNDNGCSQNNMKPRTIEEFRMRIDADQIDAAGS